MGAVLQQGFHISVVDDFNTDGTIAGPFETLAKAAMAMIDVNVKDDNGKRLAVEVFYVDEEENIYVRWKGRWAFEEDDGTVDPKAPLPDILKTVQNG